MKYPDDIISKDKVQIGDFQVGKAHATIAPFVVQAAMRCIASQLKVNVYLVQGTIIGAQFEPVTMRGAVQRRNNIIKRAEYLKAWIDGYICGHSEN